MTMTMLYLFGVLWLFADREKIITKSFAYNKQFISLSESASRISVELDEFKNSGRSLK